MQRHLYLLLVALQSNDVVRTIGPFVGGLAAVVAAAFSGWLSNRLSSARFEGIVTAQFAGHQQQIDDIKVEQRDQWKKIHDTAETVAGLKRWKAGKK